MKEFRNYAKCWACGWHDYRYGEIRVCSSCGEGKHLTVLMDERNERREEVSAEITNNA